VQKLVCFESLESSGVRGLLSNPAAAFLNSCITLLQRMVPHHCIVCGAPTTHNWVCAGCDAELPRLPPARCAVCAVPLASGTTCGACLKRPPAFDRVATVFAYAFPVDAMICALKYGRRLALAPVLGNMFADVVTPEADVLVPMPLAPRRQAERGFNQALELARVVSLRHRIPIAPMACHKVVETPPQAALPWKERAKNVRRVFVCDMPFKGLRVAIVDDVLTTGATMNELARVLRNAGATTVSGCVLARTVPR